MIPGILGGRCSNFLKVKPGIVHYFVHVKPGIPHTVKPGIVAYRKVLWYKDNPRTRAICFKICLIQNNKQVILIIRERPTPDGLLLFF